MSSMTSQTADSWPLPPSISTQVGPFAALPVGVLLLEPRKAPLEHLAHHPEIVVWSAPL